MKKTLLATLLVTFAFSLQAATTIDLTTAGASSTQGAAVGGSFTVTQISPRSTGTGVIDSFLRVQTSNDLEQGYNTSLKPLPLNDLSGNFTRALALTEVPIVNIGGVNYRQFLLDINQDGSSPLLSLNQIQIFQLSGDRNDGTLNPAASAGTYPALQFTGSPATTQVFEMSAGGTSGTQYTVKLDYSLNSGSGSGDMFLYVPNSDFDTTKTNVILYSAFGTPPGGNANNDGFEEWAVVKAAGSTCVGECTTNVPEPGAVVLLGTVLLGISGVLRRRLSAKNS